MKNINLKYHDYISSYNFARQSNFVYSEVLTWNQFNQLKLTNVNISYTPASEDWTLSVYGRNIFDERYDNARLNTGDYILQILSNDASEFGVRFSTEF